MPSLKFYLVVILAAIFAIFIMLMFVTDAYAYEAHQPTIDDYFSVAGSEYEIDPAILKAIATIESGYGESDIAKAYNNWFGWRCNDGTYMRFSCAGDGIMHVAKAISKRPHETVEEIAEWYNPHHKDEWTKLVKEVVE